MRFLQGTLGLALGFGLLGLPGLLTTSAAAQLSPDVPKPAPSKPPVEHTIRIDVQVDTKKGVPVPGLKDTDFTLLDNNQPRKLTGFRELNKTDYPTRAILVFDAVNTRYQNVSYERIEVDKFLKQSGATVPVPMELAVLTDTGIRIQNGFTQDTGALDNLLNNAVIELREITRAAGFWGADERLDDSIRAMQQLMQYSDSLPGRKLILWVSPGWPLLSGPEVELDSRQREQIFQNIVSFSSMMRHGDVTLDMLDPLGPGESLMREDYYLSFLKGIRRPNDTDLGDLSVQVLALQSGGTVTNSSDVASLIRKALTDADDWYEFTFDAPPADKPDEYHHLTVKVDQPGLIARTRDGYYAQVPSPAH